MAETTVSEPKIETARAVTPPSQGDPFIPGTQDLELLPLKEYFDIKDHHDYTGWKDDMREILAWARESGITDKVDLMSTLKDVERRLGSTIHNNRLTKVRNYLTLQRKLDRTLDEMKSLEL